MLLRHATLLLPAADSLRRPATDVAVRRQRQCAHGDRKLRHHRHRDILGRSLDGIRCRELIRWAAAWPPLPHLVSGLRNPHTYRTDANSGRSGSILMDVTSVLILDISAAVSRGREQIVIGRAPGEVLVRLLHD